MCPTDLIFNNYLLLTREIVKCSGDIFGRVSVGGVADHQAGFAHRSVTEQDALEQPLLRITRPGCRRFVRGHGRSHGGASVIHADWRGHSVAALFQTARCASHHETPGFSFAREALRGQRAALCGCCTFTESDSEPASELQHEGGSKAVL